MKYNKHERPIEPIAKPKIKKGDEVLVIAGKDRGRRGKVDNVDAKKQMVIVEGINEYKKHQKPTPRKPGGIINVAMPIHISNVQLIDKSTNRPTRVGRRLVGEKLIRYGVKSGQLIDSE